MKRSSQLYSSPFVSADWRNIPSKAQKLDGVNIHAQLIYRRQEMNLEASGVRAFACEESREKGFAMVLKSAITYSREKREPASISELTSRLNSWRLLSVIKFSTATVSTLERINNFRDFSFFQFAEKKLNNFSSVQFSAPSMRIDVVGVLWRDDYVSWHWRQIMFAQRKAITRQRAHEIKIMIFFINLEWKFSNKSASFFHGISWFRLFLFFDEECWRGRKIASISRFEFPPLKVFSH